LPPKEWTLEWVISVKDWSWEKLNASDKMPMEFYGLRTTLWFQKTLTFTARSWMRLIACGIISIQKQQDVSRYEEEFLVDENEARDSEVCVRM
jgi:hypothetical protein